MGAMRPPEAKAITYAGSDSIRDVAYYASNARCQRLHPVGENAKNGIRFIYDMSGNAAEWCTQTG